jgi:hypothetical protein
LTARGFSSEELGDANEGFIAISMHPEEGEYLKS